MTVTLELKPEEVAILDSRARAEGVNVDTVLHDLVAQLAPASLPNKADLTDKQKGAIALMQAWRREDETDDPEELAERDRDLEEFKTNINRWRAEEGRPAAY